VNQARTPSRRQANRRGSIAFVAAGLSSPEGSVGGSERQILNLALQFERVFGWSVTMVAWSKWAMSMDTSGVPGRIVLFGGAGKWDWVLWPVTCFGRLLGLNADVYYQRGLSQLTFSTALVARLKRRAFVWHAAHESDCSPAAWRAFRFGDGKTGPKGWALRALALAHEALLRRALRWADLVIFQTETQKARLEPGWGVSLRQCVVIPNGHALPVIDVHPAPGRSVLWLAGLKQFKRPEVFVELARELTVSGVACRLAGRAFGARWANWIDRISQDEGNNVMYLGELDRASVYAELKCSLALVSTSIAEGFPNTFVEAWMSGRPVVSLGFDPDKVISKYNLGYVTTEPRAAAAWIARLADDLKLQFDYAYRCREYAEAHHDIGCVAEEVRKAIEGVLRPA